MLKLNLSIDLESCPIFVSLVEYRYVAKKLKSGLEERCTALHKILEVQNEQYKLPANHTTEENNKIALRATVLAKEYGCIEKQCDELWKEYNTVKEQYLAVCQNDTTFLVDNDWLEQEYEVFKKQYESDELIANVTIKNETIAQEIFVITGGII